MPIYSKASSITKVDPKSSTQMKVLILLVLAICIFNALAFERKAIFDATKLQKKSINSFATNQENVRFSEATGTAHLVTETAERLKKRSTYNSVDEGLAAFLADHPEIGIKNPKEELVEIMRQQDGHIKDWTMILYNQVYKGLKVHGIVFKIIVNSDNQVVSSAGSIIPDLHLLDVVPSISSSDAVELAIAALPEETMYDVIFTELEIYRSELAYGRSGSNHLAYHTTFKYETSGEEFYVMLDAHNGQVLQSSDNMNHALNRTVVQIKVKVLFAEGQSEPEGDAAKMFVNVMKLIYDAMMNVGGWDSWDLKGGRFLSQIGVMTGYIRQMPCPNAAFFARRTAFCVGFENGFDVVGHEWGHAYISGIVSGGGLGLVYQGQSGALNEAYSDIIGESLQLLAQHPVDYPARADRTCNIGTNRRWVVGDQIDDKILAGKVGFRDMYNPNCLDLPSTTDDKFIVCDPEVDKGGVHFNSGVVNQVYSLYVDGGEFLGTSYTGVGLLKAFHIFIRGLGKHVSTTTFMQHVDFVKTACDELVQNSVDLVDLQTGQPTGTMVTAEDCNTLASLYSATKMDKPMCVNFTQSNARELPNNNRQESLQDSIAKPAVIAGPFPSLVMNVGEDIVLWRAEDFDLYADVWCRIEGYESFKGEIYEDEWNDFVYCQMPPFDGTGTIQMSISYDNSHWLGPYDITVHAPYTLSAYGPTSGPLEGGNTIRIEGEGFVDSFKSCNPDLGAENQPCAVCYFGYDNNGATVPATIESSTSAKCTVPSWVSLDFENRTVEVWLSMNYFIAVGPLHYEYMDGVGPVGDVPLTTSKLSFPPNKAPVASVRNKTSGADFIIQGTFALIVVLFLITLKF